MRGDARAADPVLLFLYDHQRRVSTRHAAHVRLASEIGFRTLIADWRDLRVSPTGTTVRHAREVGARGRLRAVASSLPVNPAVVLHRMLMRGRAMRLMRQLAAAHPRAVLSYAAPWRPISWKWPAELCFRTGERDGIRVARPPTYLIHTDEIADVLPRLSAEASIIFKPSTGSQCHGIRIATPETLPRVASALRRSRRGRYVAQELVADPLLYHGKKFDLRLYAIVTSFRPLVYRVYRGGVARIAARRFRGAAADDGLAALTGCCYRRRRHQRIENLPVEELLGYLSNSGYRVDDVWDRLDALMRDVFACLARHSSFDAVGSTAGRFYLAGVDVLLTHRHGVVQPLFLETNYVPQLNGWGPAVDDALAVTHREWLTDLWRISQ
jgi:hypothetical protein